MGVRVFYATVRNPPAAWRTGCTLGAEYYDDYAQYIVAYIDSVEAATGTTVTHFSAFTEPEKCWSNFPNTTMSATSLCDFVKVMGPIVRSARPDLKFVAPYTAELTSALAYAQTLLSDNTAKQYVDYIGSSQYNWVTGSKSSCAAWKNLADLARHHGKPTFCCEASHDGTNWSPAGDGVITARWLQAALVYGNVSVFNWWALLDRGSEPGSTPGLFYSKDWPVGQHSSDGITKIGYGFKQFSHWIRPGAVRIQATADTNYVFPAAFKHADSSSLTIVAINHTSQARNARVTLTGVSALSNLEAHRTSASENCIDAGAVAVNNSAFSFVLPARSTTTFSGTMGTMIDRRGEAKRPDAQGAVAIPNPVRSAAGTTVRFRVPARHNVRVLVLEMDICDATGQHLDHVFQTQDPSLADAEILWDASDYRAGVYLLRAYAGAASYVARVALQR
jgi:O-glycosyl hydrolase